MTVHCRNDPILWSFVSVRNFIQLYDWLAYLKTENDIRQQNEPNTGYSFLWVSILDFWLLLALHNIKNSFNELLDLKAYYSRWNCALCSYIILYTGLSLNFQTHYIREIFVMKVSSLCMALSNSFFTSLSLLGILLWLRKQFRLFVNRIPPNCRFIVLEAWPFEFVPVHIYPGGSVDWRPVIVNVVLLFVSEYRPPGNEP